MQNFTLSKEARRALAPYHREFQAAVAIIANHTVGNAWAPPRGIGKYEGGVVVNRLEIAIFRETVQEDWRRENKTLPEEVAVAQAIETMAAAFKADGAKVFAPFRDVAKTMSGNRLMSLFFD